MEAALVDSLTGLELDPNRDYILVVNQDSVDDQMLEEVAHAIGETEGDGRIWFLRVRVPANKTLNDCAMLLPIS